MTTLVPIKACCLAVPTHFLGIPDVGIEIRNE